MRSTEKHWHQLIERDRVAVVDGQRRARLTCQAVNVLSEDAITDDVKDHLLVECLLNPPRFGPFETVIGV